MQTQFSHALSRRRFLKLSVLLGLFAVAPLRFLLPNRGPGLKGLTNLSETQARILAAIYSRMTLETDPALVTQRLKTLDRFLGTLTSTNLRDLKAALYLLEHTPLVFHGYLSRFTGLTPEQQDRVLAGWRDGLYLRQAVYGALKELSALGLYSDPANWAAIGYTGPMVPPKRPSDWPYDRGYADLSRSP